MAQPKIQKSTTDPRLEQLMKIAEELKEDAKKNAKHIRYQSFGADKNKKRKNSKDCDRGTGTGGARYCSAHLRKIYPLDIIGDDNRTEWCVEGRHNEECCKNNPCRLCNINTNNYIKPRMVNFAKALCDELKCQADNNDPERYQRALQSFLTSHIISDYPGTNKENTILRIKVNDQVWLEYFIKLTAFSSLLKTSAPSGYKYKDRISISRKIKIQNNSNRDLIFLIEKDPSYNDPEKEESRPVVNGVGWWNLLRPAKQNEIRNIIHLNADQSIHDSFGFLIKRYSNVNKIEVELECTRHSMGLNQTAILLWSWSNVDDTNSMSSGSGSPTISTTQSLRSTSPINFGYTAPNTLNVIPTIPAIPTIPTIPTFPIDPSIPAQNQFNKYQQQSFNGRSNNSIAYYNHNSQYSGHHNVNYHRIRYDPYHAPIIQQDRYPNNNNNNVELPPIPSLIVPQNQLMQSMDQVNYNQNGVELPPDIECPSITNNDNNINMIDTFALNENESVAPASFYGIDNSFLDIDGLLNNRPSFDNESIFT